MSNPLNLSSTPASGLFGSSGSGLKLGGSTSGFNLNTSATGSSGTGFSFGLGSTPNNKNTATTGLGLGIGLNTPATSTGTSSSAGLGGALSSSTTSTIAPSLASTTKPALNIGSNPSNLSNPPNDTTQQSTSSLTNPITYKVLEDYINKWMSDLETQEKDFLNQATQLNALDKLMIENGEKIIDISSEVNRLNAEQDQLEQELNFVFSQQNDLEKAIKKLETGIEQMPLITQQSSDTSRIEMYKLLIEVDNQLKTMSIDLKDIIKRLNDTNVNLNDPVVQISKILNAHMDSLNWIEENSLLLQNQIENMSKSLEDRLRENDSSSRFLYLS